eukprot:4104824-Alexandrium_andersonii.AAC.1
MLSLNKLLPAWALNIQQSEAESIIGDFKLRGPSGERVWAVHLLNVRLAMFVGALSCAHACVLARAGMRACVRGGPG